MKVSKAPSIPQVQKRGWILYGEFSSLLPLGSMIQGNETRQPTLDWFNQSS